MHSLPVFLRLVGRPVILVGTGEAAEAKRRLLERAGAIVVGEAETAVLAIVVEDEAAVARLKARGVMVNATDRSDLCDFTLPAIVDRDPVLVAIGTGGASAGLAAALRQRLEALLPAALGDLARALQGVRARMRDVWPDPAERRQALSAALAAGGVIDPLGVDPDVQFWLSDRPEAIDAELFCVTLRSGDPDDLSLKEARMLAQADRIMHSADVPVALLDRARADAPRIAAIDRPGTLEPGITVWLEMAR